MSSLPLLLRFALLAASFAGLCAAVGTRLKLSPCVAPFTTCCGIIAILMFGGMLGALRAALWALYLLGFAGLIYVFVRRRISRSGVILALAFALYAAFLLYRFRGARFWTNDDVSHWGLVARHLLRYDRFPNGGDSYIFFQSYPLGLACFIYYVCHPLINTEAMQIVAQNLLLFALFLPVFSLVRPEGKRFYLVAAMLFFTFAAVTLFQVQLGADLPQPFFGIGAAAAIARYRDDWKRALISALPAMIAVTYAKSSGIFFALFTALMLIYIAKRGGLRGRKLAICALGLALLPVISYLLWTLHIELRFPAALESKHAVSLSAYAGKFHDKGASVIWQIAKNQLGAFYQLEKSQLLALPLMGVVSIVLLLAARRFDAGERRRVLRAYLFAVAAYLCWYVMVFFMYIFSMPTSEALRLASFSRYNGTGLVYMVGLASILMLISIQRPGALPEGLLWTGCGASALVTVLLLVMLLWPGKQSIFGIVRRKDDSCPPQRIILTELNERWKLPDGGRYLLIYRHDEGKHGAKLLHVCYEAKYEFETSAIEVVAFNEEDHPGSYQIGTFKDFSETENPMDFIEQQIDACDAVLILDEEPALEAMLQPFLESYAGDTPVYRASDLEQEAAQDSTQDTAQAAA